MAGIPSGLGGAFLAGNACDPGLPLRGMGGHGGGGADTAGGGIQPEGALGRLTAGGVLIAQRMSNSSAACRVVCVILAAFLYGDAAEALPCDAAYV